MKQQYKTNWFPTGPISSPEELVNKALMHQLIYYIPKMLYRRTVDKVRKTYNSDRQDLMNQLDSYDWDSYVNFPLSLQDFFLLDDQLKFGAIREARVRLLESLEKSVRAVAKKGGTVIEFGSGDGRNLLFLKKKFPEMNFIGVELSDVSVELSNMAAKKFGVEGVQFFCADATQDLTKKFQGQDVVLCYSIFALEMMPRIFVGAVQNMLKLSNNSVVFYEPVEELWTKDRRGLASKLRVKNLDRLRGLYDYLRENASQLGWSIVKAERPGIGINPFNETVEIHLKKGH